MATLPTGSGLQNPALVQKIRAEGSLGIPNRNDFGTYIFSGSSADDGILSGQLIRPKYNIEELKKSIDTEIDELLPVLPPEAPDTVPRPVYNEVTQSVIDLTSEIETLTSTVYALNSKLGEVEIVSESLRVDLDLKDILFATSENQTQQSVDRIQTSITQLQNAIQKSTAEAIQRASLTAQNESLKQTVISLERQVSFLEETLFGKQAQQEAGAVTSAGGLTILVSPEPNPADTGGNSIFAKIRYNQIDEDSVILYGKTLEIGNFSGETANIELRFQSLRNDPNLRDTWFSFSPSSFTLQNNEKRKVTLTITQANKSNISSLKPRTKGQDGRNYDGQLIILNRTNNDSKIIKTRLRKF